MEIIVKNKGKKPIHGIPWRDETKVKKLTVFKQTAKDFKFIPTKGRGAGGQARNKKETACICQHPASGAEGYSEQYRSFLDNKREAFRLCGESKLYKAWSDIKVAALDGQVEITETIQGKEVTRKLRMDEV